VRRHPLPVGSATSVVLRLRHDPCDLPTVHLGKIADSQIAASVHADRSRTRRLLSMPGQLRSVTQCRSKRWT